MAAQSSTFSTMKRSVAASLLTLLVPCVSLAEQLLQPVSLAQWQSRVETPTEQVTVVDYWATWCTSCLERFPAMAVMSQKYEKDGVRFISLLLEDPTDSVSVDWAEQFLAKQGGSIDHLRMTDNLMTAFEALNLIAIPVVDVIGRDGQLVARLTGDDPNKQATDADVEEAIQRAIAR